MIGTEILKFDLIESTNDYLKEHLEMLSDGTVCYSLEQTKGRGRRDNIWSSPKGNLYFSFLKKQKIDRNNVFKETIKVSVAIIELLKEFNLKPQIKYPNDILVNQKKIAGVLIETSGTEVIDSIIIGVGLNVNQDNFGELQAKATSMKLVNGQNYLIEEILEQFIKIYNDLSDSNSTYKMYKDHSMIIGRDIVYCEENYRITKIFLNGDILIKNKNKEIIIRENFLDFQSIYND